jgi:4-hydroxy-3-methylbut-2-enyl diphosphate reductase
MRVIRAEALGMCFGVRDALDAMDGIADPSGVTVHGELVHNEEVLRHLNARGFAMSTENGRTSLPLTERVVITAHGISEKERRRLFDAGKELIDTTCPLVRRVHEASQELQRAGYFLLVIGRPDHVEVQGIVGDLDHYAVVPDAAAVRRYETTRLGVICQSTTPPDEAARVLRAISDANPDADVRYIDTICRPTKERQLAARDMLRRVDALVVVGGRHSNNTRQLARLAQAGGVPVVQVQTAADLDPVWFQPFRVVGLTAGTSTLETTVDDVERTLLQIGAAMRESTRAMVTETFP